MQIKYINWTSLKRVTLICVLSTFQKGPLNEQKQKRSPVFDAGGKPEYPEKNLRKQVWTGNVHDT